MLQNAAPDGHRQISYSQENSQIGQAGAHSTGVIVRQVYISASLIFNLGFLLRHVLKSVLQRARLIFRLISTLGVDNSITLFFSINIDSNRVQRIRVQGCISPIQIFLDNLVHICAGTLLQYFEKLGVLRMVSKFCGNAGKQKKYLKQHFVVFDFKNKNENF